MYTFYAYSIISFTRLQEIYKRKLLLTRAVPITMSTGNIITSKNNLQELNRDFEYLLKNAGDDNVKRCLIAEITKEIRISAWKKWLKVLLLIAFVLSAIYVIPFLNWNASAVGRIVMIKTLKIWDWRYLYNVDCLIERNVKKFVLNNPMNTVEEDCLFCENIGKLFSKLNCTACSTVARNFIPFQKKFGTTGKFRTPI